MDVSHTGSSMKWRTTLLVLIYGGEKLKGIFLGVTSFKIMIMVTESASYQCIDILLFVQ